MLCKLRLLKELKQGKKTVRLDKVNCVLALFAKKAGVMMSNKKCKVHMNDALAGILEEIQPEFIFALESF